MRYVLGPLIAVALVVIFESLTLRRSQQKRAAKVGRGL
jgi:cell division septation protein DedD